MTGKMDCIVCDIDGTILDVSPIYDEIERMRLSYPRSIQYLERQCLRWGLDLFQAPIEILKQFNESKDIEILFLTARSTNIQHQTKIFLDDIGFSKYGLFLKENIRELPHLYKKRMLKQIQEYYNVKMFLDDEEPNRRVAKELGIFAPEPKDWKVISMVIKKKKQL